MLAKIETDEEYDEGEFKIAMLHLYSHLNTAWNERKSEIDVKNDDAELFPRDIARELRASLRYGKRLRRVRRGGRGRIITIRKMRKILRGERTNERNK